jgi:hypothetical protein
MPRTGVDWSGHLGRKVSVRYRLQGDPDHPFSEAVGVVASVATDGGKEVVTIMNRRGEAVAIPAGDLLAVKVFPL